MIFKYTSLFFTEKIAKPKYVKTGTGKGRGRPPKRLAPMEENAEELDEEAAGVPPKKRPTYVKTGTGKGRGRPPKAKHSMMSQI